MISTLLMWFPPCAMFIAVAWVTEMAWRQEEQTTKRKLIRRIVAQDTRPDLPRLLPFEERPLPWKKESWFGLSGPESSRVGLGVRQVAL